VKCEFELEWKFEFEWKIEVEYVLEMVQGWFEEWVEVVVG